MVFSESKASEPITNTILTKMKKLLISGLLSINVLFLFAQSSNHFSNNSNNSYSSGNSFNHYIGEVYGGGVIFEVHKDQNGREHGLIVSLNDQSTEQVWSNVNSVSIGSSAQSKWNGYQNTRSIIRQSNHNFSAANLCYNFCDGGFHDWYLPSVNEMGLLLEVKFKVNYTLHSIAGATEMDGENPYNSYWTSTEIDSEYSWIVEFYSGNTAPYFLWTLKNTTGRVRAIRAF